MVVLDKLDPCASVAIQLPTASLMRTLFVVAPALQVVVLDKLDPCASRRNLEALSASPRLKFIKGDISAADLVAVRGWAGGWASC